MEFPRPYRFWRQARRERPALVACLAAAFLAMPTGRGGAAPVPRFALSVTDLTPRFMAFWRAVHAEPGADADRRFALWRQLDGFAAVPPTPEGQLMARELLDSAWPRYPHVIGRIAAGAQSLGSEPERILSKVVAQLAPGRPVHIELVVYAGMLEHNAFTSGRNPGRPLVAVPIEMDATERAPVMAHEFTHAVQIATGTMSGKWERTIGATVLAEGLAARLARHLFPARPDYEFIGNDADWLTQCAARRTSILRDLQAAAQLSSSADVTRFTIGIGPAGFSREACCAGWLIVGHWLRAGRSFAALGRIREGKAPAVVRSAISEMLSGDDDQRR